MCEPWAIIAHKDGMLGGVCDPTLKKGEIKTFCGKFAANGFTLQPVFNREEYLSFIKDMPMGKSDGR